MPVADPVKLSVPLQVGFYTCSEDDRTIDLQKIVVTDERGECDVCTCGAYSRFGLRA